MQYLSRLKFKSYLGDFIRPDTPWVGQTLKNAVSAHCTIELNAEFERQVRVASKFIFVVDAVHIIWNFVTIDFEERENASFGFGRTETKIVPTLPVPTFRNASALLSFICVLVSLQTS